MFIVQGNILEVNVNDVSADEPEAPLRVINQVRPVAAFSLQHGSKLQSPITRAVCNQYERLLSIDT